jgi:uncharacterized Fe-S cluster-containing radical SAM superfamily protein
MDKHGRRVLLADLSSSIESEDAYTRVNCGGLGRLRRFTGHSMYMNTGRGVVPKRRVFRTLPPSDVFDTQVFQLGGCNWLCWYCFVDDALLAADPDVTRMTSVAMMVDLYLEHSSHLTQVLDLSGGQPELVPEWTLWTMEELDVRGLRGKVHVWVDDNLSGTFMSTFLSPSQIRYMAGFPHHSRVGCFKGIDNESVRQTTGDLGATVDGQLRAADDLLRCGFDPHFYVTLTGLWDGGLPTTCRRFFRQLQTVHPLLPLKTVPLEIRNYAATVARSGEDHESARQAQYQALVCWEDLLAEFYSAEQLCQPVDTIRLLA